MEEERATSSAAEEQAMEDDEGEDELEDDDDEGSASKECVVERARAHYLLTVTTFIAPNLCYQEQQRSISRAGGNRAIRAPSSHLDATRAHLTDWLRVPYAALAKVFSLIEATTKRLEKTSLLTAFFLLVIQRSAQGDTKSLLQAVYLCINRVSACLSLLS